MISDWRGWWALNGVCDLVFVGDIVGCFCSSYEDGLLGIEVHTPRLIARRYIRSWLLLDVLPIIPLDYAMRGIYGASMPDLDIGDAMRVLRMLKIIRWFRKRHNGAFTGDPNATHFINPSVLTLVHLILSLIISWHWTCA